MPSRPDRNDKPNAILNGNNFLLEDSNAIGPANYSFSETFESEREVISNGGNLTSTPYINYGLVMDGTAKYVMFDTNNDEFNSSEISILVDFTPAFAHDDGNNYYIMDCDVVGRFIILKDSSNRLALFLGGTSIATLLSGTYGSYWRANSRNILLISGTSGNNNAWLNGNQILTSNATAWTAKNPTELHLGSRYTGSDYFDGKFNSVKIFKSIVTP